MSAFVVFASLQNLHQGLAWVMVVGNGLVGVWALAAHRVTALRRGALWWFTALAQATIVLQVTVGVGLVVSQDIDPPQFHLFYGFVAFAVVGIVYSYRPSLWLHRYVLYGCTGIFLMGMGIRAMLVSV
ncbi:MAG: hypothetical protein P8M16_01050 [Acidimicrobiales bacterium]|nr:hypothetical protein [Acidimicrobiales bacterium]